MILFTYAFYGWYCSIFKQVHVFLCISSILNIKKSIVFLSRLLFFEGSKRYNIIIMFLHKRYFIRWNTHLYFSKKYRKVKITLNIYFVFLISMTILIFISAKNFYWVLLNFDIILPAENFIQFANCIQFYGRMHYSLLKKYSIFWILYILNYLSYIQHACLLAFSITFFY